MSPDQEPLADALVGPSTTMCAMLALSLLALGIGVRLLTLNVPQRTPDEEYYAYYATVYGETGLGSVERLVDEHGSTRRRSQQVPPTRIGWLWPLAMVTRVTGSTDRANLAATSMVASIGLLGLTLLLGNRLQGTHTLFIAGLFMACSPMDLAIARRVWQDSLIALLGLGILTCSLGMLRGRKTLGWSLGLFSLGAWSILTKESGIAILGLCALATILVLWMRGERKLAAVTTVSSGLAVLVALTILVAVSGGALENSGAPTF